MPDPLDGLYHSSLCQLGSGYLEKTAHCKESGCYPVFINHGRQNFVLTNLIAEVANSYYELLALDNQLEIVKQNIELQKNALDIVKVQKEAARATELAVAEI
jgi:multidrug efflux system outer membrane protein